MCRSVSTLNYVDGSCNLLVHELRACSRNGEKFPLRWDGRGSTRNDEMRYRKNDKQERCRNVTLTHEDAMNPFFDVDAWAERTRVVFEHF